MSFRRQQDVFDRMPLVNSDHACYRQRLRANVSQANRFSGTKDVLIHSLTSLAMATQALILEHEYDSFSYCR